jgi:DNA-3-methyladenine glycosylase
MAKTHAARLSRAFYARPTLQVARELIGCTFVRLEKINGRTRRLAGIITETEAYCGEGDLGCHAKAGITKRTAQLYGPPGYSYVYFTYGNHWLFCCVTRPEGEPEAVLIRAIQPTEGLELIAERRAGRPEKIWTDGPGKLTQALNIDGQQHGMDLTDPKAIIFIEKGQKVPDGQVAASPRIGLYTVPEPWKSKPWRYLASLPKPTEERR